MSSTEAFINVDLKDSASHTSSADEDDGKSRKMKRRIVRLNGPQIHPFCTNRICTAKYNVFSFLPKFLFEQFRRYANMFFLFITLLQQIPNVSPTGRFTTIVPLSCILGISALKEIVEDYKRHKADGDVNNREVLKLTDGQWRKVKWRDIKVGDVLKIAEDEYFPADLLLLSSSDEESTCYIETANLDGENNLKIKYSHDVTAEYRTKEDLSASRDSIECEPPNFELTKFTANLRVQGKELVPLRAENLLLRGAKLKHTNWVYGVVLYTGKETKLMMNSTDPPFKRSSIDKITNNQVLMLFFVLIVLCLVSSIFTMQWEDKDGPKSWYMNQDSEYPSTFTNSFFTFVILYNNLIPISLQIAVEVVRFFQAMFISMDIDMYYEKTNTPAMARTSNLNEELGVVRYILSDKTGTLTQNFMVFKECTIAGVKYELSDESLNNEEVRRIIETENDTTGYLRDFLTVLAVCHTVVPEKQPDSDELEYQASSPDEAALVLGAKQLGFVFTERKLQQTTIKAMDKEEQYEILNLLEFTSERQRMSVIVKTPDGKIKLFCKGADTPIYERLSDNQPFAEATQKHLDEFSKEGMRILCVAVADISPDFYDDWKYTYDKASTSFHSREKKIADAEELIEKNLFLLGATAVEDRLQEGVPEAITDFLKAGIKFWILTGDKQETAINIGYSCKLLKHTLPLLIINEDNFKDTKETIQGHINDFREQGTRQMEVALITNGKTLTHALSHELRRDFTEIALACKAVICCRVSPKQKAEVVLMIQNATNAVTLAIGDGGNDVPMIQAARVGVGISGVEGQQATCASDYSIAQFRFLKRLLFVHGAWNHERLAKLILYSFYKNIILYIIELWFAFVSAWSGQTVFEKWTIGLYNLVFTALPPMAIGLFNRTCSAEARLRFPALYKPSELPQSFNLLVFWIWVLNAILDSLVLFCMSYFMIEQDVLWSSGKTGGLFVFGNMVYSYVVVVACLKAGLEMNAWTWLTHVAIWGSIICWFLFLWGYCNCWPVLPIASSMLGVDIMVVETGVFWFGLILVPFTVLLGDFTFKVLRRSMNKTFAEEVMEYEALHSSEFTK